MNTAQYQKIAQPFQGHPKRIFLLNVCNRLFTIIGFIMYPALLLLLALHMDKRILSFILIPACSFFFLSVLRKKMNCQRPYETLSIQPIIKRDKKGESFPSRHVFSIFIIATIWFDISHIIGTLLIFIGFLLAIIRVIGGVHFPKDVLCGAILGVFCGLIAIFLF